MEGALGTAAGLGFLLGLRHALDPDHVVAVSTLVGGKRGLRGSSLVGACWGAGHALALLVAGGAVLAFKVSLPAGLERWLEPAVAVMLIGLGVQAIAAARAGWRVHAHRHTHDGSEHVHLHAHRPGPHREHGHPHPLASGLRPFLVGVVHGLAGSAGLALLVLGAAPSVAAGLACIGMLGLGSLAGMLLLSGLLSLPLDLLAGRYAGLHHRFQFLAGAASIAFGLWLLGQQGVLG